MFTGTDHQPVIRTQSFYFQCFKKKTKLFSFNTSTVTFFLTVSNLLARGSRKRSYLLPRENFKLSYLPNQDSIICIWLRSSLIHSVHQKSCEFIHGNFAYLARICASLIWPRLRGEEGNCSYLLPLSHRGCVYVGILNFGGLQQWN